MKAAALLACALVCSARVALADDVSVAAETFRAGSASYARKDYRAAALSFELSNRLAPHALALYSAGLAWQAAGENARAATDYEAAAADERLPEAQRKDTATRLEQLRPALGHVRVTAPTDAAVSVAYVDGQRAPVLCYLAPGRYDVHVLFASGQNETRSIEVAAGDDKAVEVEAPPQAAPEPAPTPPAAVVAPVAVPQPDASRSTGSTRKALGWVSLGVGALGVGTGVALGVAALGARDDFVESGRFDAAARDRASTLRTFANVGYFAGGALAITGVVLIATAPRAVTTAVALGPQGVRFHARF